MSLYFGFSKNNLVSYCYVNNKKCNSRYRQESVEKLKENTPIIVRPLEGTMTSRNSAAGNATIKSGNNFARARTYVTSRSIKSQKNGKISGRYEIKTGTQCDHPLSLIEDAFWVS